jgi:hypothetical protein
MSGAITPLPNTPLWRGAQLKHRDNFNFTSRRKWIYPIHAKQRDRLSQTNYEIQTTRKKLWENFEVKTKLWPERVKIFRL